MLELKYPEVKGYKKIYNLENKDKDALEDLSQDESNNFWDWLFQNYGDLKGSKLTTPEVNGYIGKYCEENEILQKDIMKYFWKTSRYEKKKIRIGNITTYGVYTK